MKHPSYGALHTYIHTDRQTDRQSDMGFFFLRMRLLASPFGLAIKEVLGSNLWKTLIIFQNFFLIFSIFLKGNA
jgi:hypothetical protein